MPFKIQPPYYQVWRSMIERCRNPRFHQWMDYGGRGIKVCARWQSYKAWAADMGERPTGYVLDRINNDGDYSPENCQWASRKQSQRNRRVTKWVRIEGRDYRAADLAEASGLKSDTIVARAVAGLPYSAVISPERRVNTDGLAIGGAANGARQSAKTHCKNGHPFNEENTYTYVYRGSRRRQCRACRRHG